MVKAIVGANWGDEGKGKITDMLAGQSDMVIRFQGGANAGHTIINSQGKFVLHLLPSGVLNKNTVNIIGNGVALDIRKLVKEVNDLTSRGVDAPNLLVSDRAQIMMPYHVDFDTYEEERLSSRSFGSTKSGIAPFYSDKYAKVGVQVCELFDLDSLRKRLIPVLEYKNALLEHLYKKPLINMDSLMSELAAQRDMIAPYVADTASRIAEAIAQDKTILLEGQLGSLKDPDFGIYPFTTSSSTLAGFGAVGAGIAPYEIKQIYCVTKAYSSAVGAGAFVSEIFDGEADIMRRLGGDAGEFGATTGRPRRMGWFDCVATRYGCKVQGATDLVLTALDVLGYLDEIPVCVGYEIDGKTTGIFPSTPTLNKAKPILKTVKGWKSDIRGCKNYSELPKEAKDYISLVQDEIDVKIAYVSTGPDRSETIKM